MEVLNVFYTEQCCEDLVAIPRGINLSFHPNNLSVNNYISYVNIESKNKCKISSKNQLKKFVSELQHNLPAVKEFNKEELLNSIEYSIEQQLGALFYHLEIIKHVNCQSGTSKILLYTDSSFLLNIFSHKSTIIEYLNCDAEIIEIKSKIKGNKSISAFGNYLYKFYHFFIRRWLNLKSTELVISSTSRRLERLYNSERKRTVIYRDILFLNRSKRTSSTKDVNKRFSCKLFLEATEYFLEGLEKDLMNCKRFIQYLNCALPKVYLTVNVASSLEYLKAISAKKAGVRVVVSTEGFNFIDQMLISSYASTFKFGEGFDRWLLHPELTKYYKRYGERCFISGWDLPETKNKLSCQSSDLFVIALSKASIFNKRLDICEDPFEMSFFIDEAVCQILSLNEQANIVLRVHPNDSYYFEYLTRYYESLRNVKVDYETSLEECLKNQPIVIGYNTTVLFEAIFFGCQVYYIDYLSRPNYTEPFYNWIKGIFQDQTRLIRVSNLSLLSDAIRSNQTGSLEPKLSDIAAYFRPINYRELLSTEYGI